MVGWLGLSLAIFNKRGELIQNINSFTFQFSRFVSMTMVVFGGAGLIGNIVACMVLAR